MKKTGIILSIIMLVLCTFLHFYINKKNHQPYTHFTFFILLASLQVLRLGLAYSVRNKDFSTKIEDQNKED